MEKPAHPPPYAENVSAPIGFVPPPHHPPNATVTQVVVGVPTQFGPHEQSVTCPHCKHQIVTRTETKANTKTHLIALILCLVGCWLCCCIPYCVDSCQDKNHYCPNCNAYLGTYKD